MHTVKILTNLVEYHQVLAYLAIYIGLIVEGEFVVISTGIMAHLGALNFWFSLFFIMAGGLTKTFLGYQIGKIVHNKWQDCTIVKFVERRVNTIMPRFKQKPFWSIFASKFIMGFNNAVILFSGFLKVNYKQYLKAEFSSTVIWAPLLMCLGFFFSYTALHVSKEISKFSLVVLLLVIAYIVFDKFVGWLYELFEEFYGEKEK